MRRWGERTGIAIQRFIRWLGMAPSKFYEWWARYGQVNEHDRWIPRDIDYYHQFRLHSALGYVTSLDKLEARAEHIFAECDRKLQSARSNGNVVAVLLSLFCLRLGRRLAHKVQQPRYNQPARTSCLRLQLRFELAVNSRASFATPNRPLSVSC